MNALKPKTVEKKTNGFICKYRIHEFNSFIHESFLNVLYVDTHPGFIYLFLPTKD